MGRFSFVPLVSLLTFTTCGDSVTGPIVMSVGEIRNLMFEIAGVLDATGTPFYLRESVVLFSVHGTPPETYAGEAACPQGGSVTNEGGGEVGEAVLDVTFTQTFENCRTESYTVNGTHHVVAAGSNTADTITIDVAITGELAVRASGDRHGTCTMDYGYVITAHPAAQSFQPRGTICGEDILRITGVPVSF